LAVEGEGAELEGATLDAGGRVDLRGSAGRSERSGGGGKGIRSVAVAAVARIVGARVADAAALWVAVEG
jgi:hypothetical protein